MLKKISQFVFLLFTFFLSFSNVFAADDLAPLQIFADELKQAYKNPELAAIKQRTPLNLYQTQAVAGDKKSKKSADENSEAKAAVGQIKGGSTKYFKILEITTCEKYLELLDENFVPASSTDAAIAGHDYTICKASEILEKSAGYSEDNWEKDYITELYKNLDISKFFNTLVEQNPKLKTFSAAASRNKMAAFVDSSIKLKATGNRPWIYNMEVLAKGDFDDDGSADLLAQFTENSTGSVKYYDSQLLLLSKKDDEIELIEELTH